MHETEHVVTSFTIDLPDDVKARFGAEAQAARCAQSASVNLHGLRAILIFHVQDFTRYPGIPVLPPKDV